MAKGEIDQMKKSLCIGLISPSKFLISVLNSIGVWYENADLTFGINEYALLIIDGNTSLSREKIESLNTFVSNGGLILELSTEPRFYSNSLKKTYTKTVINKGSSTVFDRISHLDVYSICSFSNSNILSGLVDFKTTSQSGTIGYIGLDLKNLPPDTEFIRKRFLSPYSTYPDEIVNKVSLGALQDVIELSIQHLLFLKNLPFVKKWTSPKKNPIFGFRIDSDYGTKDSLQKIESLLEQHSIKATWFLHVESHESWLDYFKTLKGQELALHGYRHGYSDSFSAIKANIETGLSLLNNEKINPNGFCAPYGIWNDGLEKALEQFDFIYSSEFSTSYDSVPFFQQNSKNLQIPIHPICTGSMSRKRYSIDNIQRYFLHIYNQKLAEFKPIIFYHHPLQIGLQVFDKIFEKVNSDKLTNLTFEEYARFWTQRNASEFKAYIQEDKIEIVSNSSSLLLYISEEPDSFNLIPSKNEIIGKGINTTFKYETPSLPSLHELQKLHHNRINLMKTSFIDWKNRHRL